MKIYGLLGWPAHHSLSPSMQNAAFQALKIDASYVLFPVAPANLKSAISGIRTLGIAGVNITIPHKVQAMNLVDEVDAQAQAIGAINTIFRKGDRLIGTNTDARGFVRSLEKANVDLKGKNVVVLGAGGAARAIVSGLQEVGCSLVVAARRQDAAKEIGTKLNVETTLFSHLVEHFKRAALIVQATNATMTDAAESFARSLPWDALPSHTMVIDIVYRPKRTAVLREASDRGFMTLDGTHMLVHQGALSFETWTHKPAPIIAMYQAIQENPQRKRATV